MRHKSATPLERNEALSQQHSRRLSKLSLGRSSIDIDWLVSTPPINHLYLSLRYLSWIKVEKNVVLLTKSSEIYNWTNLAKDFQFDLFDSPQPLNNRNFQSSSKFSKPGVQPVPCSSNDWNESSKHSSAWGKHAEKKTEKKSGHWQNCTSQSWQAMGIPSANYGVHVLPLSRWNHKIIFPAPKIKPQLRIPARSNSSSSFSDVKGLFLTAGLCSCGKSDFWAR